MKIDLHMHSFYSKKYDPKRVKEMSASELVATLKSKGIEVFSVTDHDCFSSKYFNEIKSAIAGEGIKAIPGAELNIYVKDNNKFQANFYFSLDTPYEKLENAIKSLYGKDSKPNLGRIIDKFHEEQFNFIIFPEADKAGGISKLISHLDKNNDIDLIKEIQKNGMQRIFRAYDSRVSFDKTAANQWAWSYFKASEEFHEAFDQLDEDEFKIVTDKIVNQLKGIDVSCSDPDCAFVTKIVKSIVRYASCFSYFHFSDWHNKETYEPKAQNFIYGNTEKPFESLELAVLDPASRVEVYDVSKTINNNPSNCIKSVSFILDGEETKIDFSVGLNAIVGKRASGKSLLMAILLKLSKQNDTQLDRYTKTHKIDIGSISCEMFDGQTIKPGQLSSLSYIEQNTISEIFNNPESSENGMKKYFGTVDDFDASNLNEIVSELKELSPYDNNYKSVTSFIKNSKTFKTYSFSAISKLNSTSYESSFIQLKNALDNFEKSLIGIGFINTSIKDTKNELITIKSRYDEKIKIYNKIIAETNSKIKEIAASKDNQQQLINLAKADHDSAKRVIQNNIRILVHLKKLEYLVKSFKISLPKLIKNRSDKYLFASYYEAKGDVKESLNDYLENPFSKRGHSEKGFELIKGYVNGSVSLKNGQANIYKNIESKFISENLQLKNVVYEMKNSSVFDQIETVDDLKSAEESGKIENISNSSLGRKSAAYLELLLDSGEGILLFDQPEDNVDNNYISHNFVPLIKAKKKTKQLIFITHNPSVAVYADAFNYIYAVNDGTIKYSNHYIETPSDKEKILDILDGGNFSFSNRNQKYGNVIGEYKYAVKDDQTR